MVRSVFSTLALLASACALCAQVPDAMLATGRMFAPFTISFRPSLQMSPMPGWMRQPANVSSGTATVEIPIPALWAVPAVQRYAITVVFDDRGDGGPAIEWRSPDGTSQTLSTGLGESDRAIGWNARTVLLPGELTNRGGVVLVSYYGGFEELLSVSVRPARNESLAVLGPRSLPALLDEAGHVITREDSSGRRVMPPSGDVRNGSVLEAELSAGTEELVGELEFVIPMEAEAVEAASLQLEALGLDLESRLEVRVNGVLVGNAEFGTFRLDDPALVTDADGRALLAGWRPGFLFLPARLWSAGDNSLVLSVRRGALDPDRKVFLRRSFLHLKFGAANPSLPQGGEPDFTLPEPLVPDPEDPPLPEIITGPRPE